jgi:CRP/FNR family transcriptional regulator, cyclic AMP receptor protein
MPETGRVDQPTFGRGTFLAGLSPATREALLALGTAREFEAGRVLLREGDEEATHVELLLRGFVKVTVVVDEIEALLSVRVPGDILGESATLRDRARTATVTTCGPVRSVAVTKANFRRFLEQHAEAALSVAAMMSDRLLFANQRRGEFAAYPAHVRLARVLAELGKTCGAVSAAGITLGVMLSQSELATMVGIADATMHKAMAELRRRQLVRTGYRQITILDFEALKAVGDSG